MKSVTGMPSLGVKDRAARVISRARCWPTKDASRPSGRSCIAGSGGCRRSIRQAGAAHRRTPNFRVQGPSNSIEDLAAAPPPFVDYVEPVSSRTASPVRRTTITKDLIAPGAWEEQIDFDAIPVRYMGIDSCVATAASRKRLGLMDIPAPTIIEVPGFRHSVLYGFQLNARFTAGESRAQPIHSTATLQRLQAIRADMVRRIAGLAAARKRWKQHCRRRVGRAAGNDRRRSRTARWCGA